MYLLKGNRGNTLQKYNLNDFICCLFVYAFLYQYMKRNMEKTHDNQLGYVFFLQRRRFQCVQLEKSFPFM